MRVKKSNIEIVRDYLKGERPFVQVGYTPKTTKRKEGEEWEDVGGKRWKMVNGNVVSVNKQADLIRTLITQKCSCGQDMKYGNRMDEKFFIKTGKCFDCVIKEETELRILGVFPYYERYKMLSNYLGFLQDIKRKIEDSIKYFSVEGDTLDVICNSEGFIEKFKGMNTGDLLVGAKKDLELIKVTIATVTKDKSLAKKIYKTELAKAKKKPTSK